MSANAAFFTLDNDFVLQVDSECIGIHHLLALDEQPWMPPGELPRFCRHLFINFIMGCDQ